MVQTQKPHKNGSNYINRGSTTIEPPPSKRRRQETEGRGSNYFNGQIFALDSAVVIE